MTSYINVPLSEQTYRRVKQWAKAQRQGVGEAIAAYLDDTMLPTDALPVDPNPAVDSEKAAYLVLHEQLLENYEGDYVAIYQGELIDHDIEFATLYARVNQQHPDTFVLIRQVDRVPDPVYHFRSPRFVEKG